MKKTLVATMVSAMTLVSAPAFANIVDLPICPDAIEEQTCPCRPTATTEIRTEVDIKSLPQCLDKLEDQEEFGKCRPSATTEIKTEIDVKSLPICPDKLEDQEGFGACRPTATTEIRTTSESNAQSQNHSHNESYGESESIAK